ncbi:MAG: DDE-type integrase/transposase/recombinase [Thaumarchaeota archaeon]|nr:DDE-type integrase/transposase/recombinase [Nitrososphaerota archaeon]MCL5067064.1 DDE-type integrase/transposase/recombinase [Nitrososphaerota archaeon]
MNANKDNGNGNLDGYLSPKEVREDRGLALFEKARKTISENGDGSFSVPSASIEEIAYTVRVIQGQYVCNCPDYVRRHEEIETCKHGIAAKLWIASRVELESKPKPKIFADDAIQCVKCGSIRVIKFGTSHGKQAYKCNDCLHRFRETNILKRARYTPELVSLTLDLYFSGTSLRKIARIVNSQHDMNLGASSIYRWIQKYIPKISQYVDSFSPELSETWHGDELFVKMRKGIDYNKNKKIAFLWNIMDRKTRFLLASKLSPLRDDNGAFQGFKEARANSHGQYPEKIYVDKAGAYNNIAYAHAEGWNPQVIQKAGINKPHANNNRIERLNGTLRERVKVSRGWKSMQTQIPEGMRIHYNFVKPHESLAGMTPAQRANIPINSKNKWLELLLASQKENTT